MKARTPLYGLVLQPDWTLPEEKLQGVLTAVWKTQRGSAVLMAADLSIWIDCPSHAEDAAILTVAAGLLEGVDEEILQESQINLFGFESVGSEAIAVTLAALPLSPLSTPECAVREIRSREQWQQWQLLSGTQPSQLEPQYQFTQDWFAHNLPAWEFLFHHLLHWNASEARQIIEIGCFEGRSTCWMAETLLVHPQSRLYCIDTFAGSAEHAAALTDQLYQRFLRNIEQTGRRNQIRVCRGTSEEHLIRLLGQPEGDRPHADFIYIDGSHQARDVLSDAVLSWKLLKPGGVMIFDDYLWTWRSPSGLAAHPKMAVDAFVNIHFQELEFLHVPGNYQFYLRKIKDP